MITLRDLFYLLRDGVDLCSWVVIGTPSHVVGAIPALATYPTPAELFKEAELVGTLGFGIYWRCICGVVAGSGDPSSSVEMGGHAMIVGH